MQPISFKGIIKSESFKKEMANILKNKKSNKKIAEDLYKKMFADKDALTNQDFNKLMDPHMNNEEALSELWSKMKIAYKYYNSKSEAKNLKEVFLGKPSNTPKFAFVGLPKSGKSMTFDFIKKRSEPAEEYPDCINLIDTAKVKIY